MSRRALVYGSNGYTGRAISNLAVERGLELVLAGRNQQAIGEQALDCGVDHRVFDLSDRMAVGEAIAGVEVVLNCAGPFVHTHRPLLDACLRSGTHYLDLTGEPPVYEAMEALDQPARAAGIMILPSVGFDVVATDCLAVHLKNRLPSATHLTLAFHQDGPAGAPPGTLETLIEMLPYGSTRQHRVSGVVRRDSGRRKVLEIDFGEGPVEASMMTWGDLYLAHRSTGIANIENYVVMPTDLRRQLDLSESLRPFFRVPLVRALAKRGLEGGATTEELRATQTRVWGEVSDDEGNRASARLLGPEAGLVWTSRAAVEVLSRVLEAEFRPGFQTPATVYGPDLTMGLEGVTRWEDDLL